MVVMMPDEEPENLQQYLPKHAQTATFKKAEERITEGEYCPRCGYDLRGIMRGHPCPECGRPTKRAGALGRGGWVVGDFDLEYLKRVRYGLWLVIVWWLMVVVGPVILVATSANIFMLYIEMEIGICAGMIGAYLISVVPKLAIAAGGKQSRWLIITMVFGMLSLGAITQAHYQLASAPLFLMRLSVAAQWQFFGLLFIIVYQVLLCLKGKLLAENMGDEALGRKFWNLAWILPISIIFTYFMAMLLMGSLLGFIFLCFTIVPFAAIGGEIAFVLYVNSLQNDFAWAVRYQYDDEARQERRRRKKGTVGTTENDEQDGE